jgi:hypothetical protein
MMLTFDELRLLKRMLAYFAQLKIAHVIAFNEVGLWKRMLAYDFA